MQHIKSTSICSESATSPCFFSFKTRRESIFPFFEKRINTTNDFLEKASEQLLHDREFILTVVKVEGLALTDEVPHFQNDKEIVMAAVMQNGWALQFTSNEPKNQKVPNFFWLGPIVAFGTGKVPFS